jgi:cytochrome c-type biogenesis protein CcmH
VTPFLRRWGPWAALVLVLAAVLVVGATRSGSHPSVEQQTLSIAGRVRCPVCQGESAAQSDTPSAAAIRQRISSDLSRGQSSGEILHSLEASYGVGILESPPTSGIALWAWVTPAVVVVLATVGLALGFRHWRRRSGAFVASGSVSGSVGDVGVVGSGSSSRAGVSAEDEALVREALAERARVGQNQRARVGANERAQAGYER